MVIYLVKRVVKRVVLVMVLVDWIQNFSLASRAGRRIKN